MEGATYVASAGSLLDRRPGFRGQKIEAWFRSQSSRVMI